MEAEEVVEEGVVVAMAVNDRDVFMEVFMEVFVEEAEEVE